MTQEKKKLPDHNYLQEEKSSNIFKNYPDLNAKTSLKEPKTPIPLIIIDLRTLTLLH